jgi:hypothetical protein
MADSLEVLERQVRRSRRSLESNLTELQARAETAADWRTHYRTHVSAVVGAALLGGVMIGAFTRGRRASALRTGAVGQVATRIVDALLATAATAAIEVVAELIPGFGREYQAQSAAPHRAD